MSRYIKVKKISIFFIYISVFAVVVATGGYFLLKNKVGADTTNSSNTVNTNTGGDKSAGTADPKISEEKKRAMVQESKPTFVIDIAGNSTKLIMVDVTTPGISDFTYFKINNDGTVQTVSQNNDGITKSLNDSDCGGIRRTGVLDYCYIFTYNRDWIKPRVLAPAGVGWLYINEMYNRASSAGDEFTKSVLALAKIDYAAGALDYWDGADISQKAFENHKLIIRDPALVKKLGDKINLSDPYVTVSNVGDKEGNPVTVTVSLADSYPLATKDSLWLAAVDTIEGSVIVPWRQFGVGLEDKEKTLMDNRAVYVNYAAAASSVTSSSGTALTTEGSQRIIIGSDGAAKTPADFNITISSSKFPAPTGGYKTEVYLKPASKSGSDVHIYTRIDPANTSPTPTGDAKYKVGWADLLSKPYQEDKAGVISTYVDTALTTAGDMSYQKKFGQQYVLTVITYKKTTANGVDTWSEQERLATPFQTVNDTTFSAATSDDSTIDANTNIKISVAKSSYNKDAEKSVPFTVTLKDLNTPHKMKKIVIWVCGGDNVAVVNSNSSSCQAPDGSENIKAVYATSDLIGSNPWTPLEYSSTGEKTLTGAWDISGTAPGLYSLMAKAYSTNEEGSDVAKIAVAVSVTDSTVVGNTPDAKYGNALNFGDAFAVGSSITTVEGLAERVITIILWAIAAVSLIAIIIGGIFYISAGSDEKKIEKGKKTIIYAVVGIMIASSGYFLYGLILDMIGQIIGK